MHSEYRDPKPLPGERPVPSIKIDALKLLGLLLRAELMMTAVDRRRYANRAIEAIEDVIRDFQLAHDFEDERLHYLKKMWADIAVFMDLMRIIGEVNAIRVNLASGRRKDGEPVDMMTPDQMKHHAAYNIIRKLVDGAVSKKWARFVLFNWDRLCFQAARGFSHNEILQRKYHFKLHKNGKAGTTQRFGVAAA